MKLLYLAKPAAPLYHVSSERSCDNGVVAYRASISANKINRGIEGRRYGRREVPFFTNSALSIPFLIAASSVRAELLANALCRRGRK
jgi:hypothetical protein